ncbi:hypothetical protein GCM10010170_012110 [Dactylosporangium salmoneum]|uniref:Uncharacterized protein n=1 Tax=Dactylosporangium salmoneum TaxID=53361 RepID=A0ABP5SNK4_9ACTN
MWRSCAASRMVGWDQKSAGTAGGCWRRRSTGGVTQFEAAQRTCALRWLAVLWKQRDRRAAEFLRQLDRVRLLQSADSPWRL